MEDFEKSIKLHNLQKSLKIETEFEVPIEGIIKGGEGLKGGKIIGHTKSGRPIYEGGDKPTYNNISMQDVAQKVYDKLDYKDMQNESKIRFALKSMGYSDISARLMVGRVKSHLKEGMKKAEEAELEKARSGTYKPTKANIKHGRAGERYGNMVNGGSTQSIGEDYHDAPKFADYRKINDNPKDGRNAADVWQQDLYEYSRKKLEKQMGKKPSEHEATVLYDKLWKKDSESRGKSLDTLYKAFEDGFLSKDVFEKGKPGQIGETRTWNGVQMKKVSSTGNSAKDWQPIKQGEGGQKQEEQSKPGEGKLTEEDLAEHAKQSSEQALANAIKSSPDPTVRQVAHQEIQRRQKEEKPTDSKGEFPSKEFVAGEKEDKKEPAKKEGKSLGDKMSKMAGKAQDRFKSYGKKEGGEKEDEKKKYADYLKKYQEIRDRHKKEKQESDDKMQGADKQRSKEEDALLKRQDDEHNKLSDEAKKKGTTPAMSEWKALKDHHTKEYQEHGKKHREAMDKLMDERDKLNEKHQKELDEHLGITSKKAPEEKKSEQSGARKLPETNIDGKDYIVDFKLEEIRDKKTAEVKPFKSLDEKTKAKLRGVRAEFGQNVHIPSLDNPSKEEDKDKYTPEQKKHFDAVLDWIGEDYTHDQIASIQDQLDEAIPDGAYKIKASSPADEADKVNKMVDQLRGELRPGLMHKDLNEKKVDEILWGIVRAKMQSKPKIKKSVQGIRYF